MYWDIFKKLVRDYKALEEVVVHWVGDYEEQDVGPRRPSESDQEYLESY